MYIVYYENIVDGKLE